MTWADFVKHAFPHEIDQMGSQSRWNITASDEYAKFDINIYRMFGEVRACNQGVFTIGDDTFRVHHGTQRPLLGRPYVEFRSTAKFFEGKVRALAQPPATLAVRLKH